jgi:hypothetical protein
MRERVAALSGTLTAGPRYGGGFRVHAILPLDRRTGTPGSSDADADAAVTATTTATPKDGP